MQNPEMDIATRFLTFELFNDWDPLLGICILFETITFCPWRNARFYDAS
jgi:hypothetical protein